MNDAIRILVVDDDAGIRTLVSSYLGKYGFETDVAADVAAMRSCLGRETYDLIVLDVMMPGEDGLAALRQLHGQGAPPVIMLSAVGTDIDRIVGLEMGAEDYLAKPCNPRELLARIRTVLRRRAVDSEALAVLPTAPTSAEHEMSLYFEGWRLDLVVRTLHDPEGKPVTLSDGEFALLRAFVEHPRRVLSRDQLLDYARGRDSDHYDRAIDVQISRLRKKMDGGATDRELIRTIRNEGYMFMPKVTR